MRLDFCALCARKEGLEHHHFRPLSLGGSDDETNLFTVCGECHGKIHDIPRPLFLGDLIKAGRDKDRTAEELQKIAASRAISAQNAEIKAKEAKEAAWREIERLRRIVRRPLPKMPTVVPRPNRGKRTRSLRIASLTCPARDQAAGSVSSETQKGIYNDYWKKAFKLERE